MSDNVTSVYGGAASAAAPADTPKRKTRVHHLQAMKAEGRRWAELTAYDYSSARIFEEAGIPVLLVGDSAANVVYGYDTTVPVTVDELLPLVRGVVRGVRTRSSSPTCRSARTRPRLNRPSPRPCGS